jgi:VanZ family protein
MRRIIVFLKPFAKYLLIFWTILILVVSSLPSLPTPKIDTARFAIRLDYIIHFCEYGILAFLSFLSFAGNDFKMSFRKYIFISLCLIVFAILDEFHQKLIPGRAFNVKDILSNLSGILAALLFCFMIFRNIGYKHWKVDRD